MAKTRILTQEYFLYGNPHSNNQSGYRGVKYIPPKPKKLNEPRYQAELQYDHVRYRGGFHPTPEAAYMEYKKLVMEHVPATD